MAHMHIKQALCCWTEYKLKLSWQEKSVYIQKEINGKISTKLWAIMSDNPV